MPPAAVSSSSGTSSGLTPGRQTRTSASRVMTTTTPSSSTLGVPALPKQPWSARRTPTAQGSASTTWASRVAHRRTSMEASDGLDPAVSGLRSGLLGDARKEALRNSLNGGNSDRTGVPSARRQRITASATPSPRPPTFALIDARTDEKLLAELDEEEEVPVVLDRPRHRSSSPKKAARRVIVVEEADKENALPADPHGVHSPRKRGGGAAPTPRRSAAAPLPLSSRTPREVEKDPSPRKRSSSPSKSAAPGRLTLPQPFAVSSSRSQQTSAASSSSPSRRPLSTASAKALPDSSPNPFASCLAAEEPRKLMLTGKAEVSKSLARVSSPSKPARSLRSSADEGGASALRGVSSTAPLRRSPEAARTMASDAPSSSPTRRALDLTVLRPSPGRAKRGMFRHECSSDEEGEGEGRGGAGIERSHTAHHQPWSSPLTPPERHGELFPGESSTETSPVALRLHREREGSESHGKSTTSRIALGARSLPRPSRKERASEEEEKELLAKALSPETNHVLASLEASIARLSSTSSKRSSRNLAPSPSKAAVTEERQDQDEDGPGKGLLSIARPRTHRSLSPSKEAELRMRQGSPSKGGALPLSGSNSFLDRVRAVQAAEAELAAKRSSHAAEREREREGQETETEEKVGKEDKPMRRRSVHVIQTLGAIEAERASSYRRDDASEAKPDTVNAPEAYTAEGMENMDAEEIKAARKAAKAARRKSLYTYVPIKRDEVVEGDEEGSKAQEEGGAYTPSARSPLKLSPMTTTTTTCSATPTLTPTPTSSRAGRFLRGLVILVDVRDQDGEDASSTWVELLRSVGAKVLVRPSDRLLTHIVFKSGRPSTLHHFRACKEPKPLLVGVNWVVKCLAEGKKVNETDYLVEVGKEAVWNKRRTSMAPRLAPGSASTLVNSPSSSSSASSSVKPTSNGILGSTHVNPFTTASHTPTARPSGKTVELARLKSLAHAPAVPSPLARRAWNLDDTVSTDGGSLCG